MAILYPLTLWNSVMKVRFFIWQVHSAQVASHNNKYHIFSSSKLSRFEALQIQILPKAKAARSRSHLLQQVDVIVCLLGAASKEH